MAKQIIVEFAGPGSGTGELTWGQQQIWATMQATQTSQSLRVVEPLPPGKTVEDLAAELKFLMCRYESMRTRLRFDTDGMPAQVVSDHGEIALEIVDAGEQEDPAQTAEELADRWESTKFDYASEWPMRLGAVRHRGVPTHVVVVLSHLAADAGGAAVMMTDLAEQVGTPASGIGPLELAQLQRSPAVRRQSDSALRYWERLLTTVAPHRFWPQVDRGEPRYRQVTLTSPAMHLATNRVANRLGIATSPVLLAAFAVALEQVTGNNPVLTQVIVSNRFRPGLADATHPLSQNGLLLIDAAAATFAEVAQRAQLASILGSKHAYYDPVQCGELCDRMGVDIGCVYNDRRPFTGSDSTAPAALAQRKLSWGKPLPLFNEKLMVTVGDGTDGLEVLAEVDTHHVPAAEVESIVLAMEAVVTEAAI